MHEVLVNRLGGLSLPRKSVVRLTDRPDMTLDVYRGRKTIQQQQHFQMEATFVAFGMLPWLMNKIYFSCGANTLIIINEAKYGSGGVVFSGWLSTCLDLLMRGATRGTVFLRL